MTNDPPDADLLERWRRGDRLAGSQLVQRHRAALYDFLRFRLARDVDDVAQQTLLACVEHGGGWRGEASFRTYLLSIARYQVYAQYRARQKLCGLDEAPLDALAQGPSPPRMHDRDARSLSIAFAQLPPMFRQVLWLAYYEDLDSFQIARQLGIPAPTVRSRQRRALSRLRKTIASVDQRA